jgi:fatty-acyl-CoA synthase
VQLLVGDIFRHAAAAVPDRTAAAMGDRSLTFADLGRLGGQVAEQLAALGLGRGDVVLVWSATALEVVPVFVGSSQAGTAFAPMSPLLGPDEARKLLAVARPSLLLADAARAPLAVELGAEQGVPVALLDPVEPGRPTPADLLTPSGLPTLPTLAGLARERGVPGRAPGEVRETDPHVVFFTSGSTGTPKGAVISHRASFLRSHPGGQFEPRGVAVCMYPMFHMAPWTISLLQWHARAGVAFVEAATAEAICAAVVAHQAERLNAIPAVWQRLLDHLASPEASGDELASLRWADTGTSATPPALIEAMLAALPDARTRVFYGSTEAGNVAGLEHDDLRRKPGSIGVPSVSSELRTDDDGEMLVRSPVLFDGYLNDEAATAAALVDGWYRTGDLAIPDDEGYWSIVGRAREIIRTGGESVAPVEVEAVLASCPGIEDVAVVGLPDDRWGEVVCAVVVVGPDGSVDLEVLRGHCDGRLAQYKHPRRLVAVAEIPRTASTRQVQRRSIVERLLSGMETW